MHEPVKLAVVGAGLIGQRHIAAIAQAASVELVGVVEPNGVSGHIGALLCKSDRAFRCRKRRRCHSLNADALACERGDGLREARCSGAD